MTPFDRVRFGDVISDVSAGSPKIQQSAYSKSGQYVIVDQGQGAIAGYTNDEAMLSGVDLPVLVFGDHTRRFKYIDRPFAVGADGVKLLSTSGAIDPRFAYWYLSSVDLPNAGYSRHFKFVKDLTIPLPPFSEQLRIAEILDRADELRAKRRRALALLDKLVDAEFDAAFELSDWPVHTLGSLAATQGGLTVNRSRANYAVTADYLRVANVSRGRIDLSDVKKIGVTAAELTRASLRAGDILLVEGHGNIAEVGRAARWDDSDRAMTHQNHLIRVRPITELLRSEYLERYLNGRAVREYFRSVSKTTSGLNTINMTNVKEVPVLVPSLEEQDKFVTMLRSVTRARASQSSHLAKLDELFASLQHRAFEGTL